MSFSNFAKVDTIYVNILLQLNLYFILNMSSIIIFSSIALLIFEYGEQSSQKYHKCWNFTNFQTTSSQI